MEAITQLQANLTQHFAKLVKQDHLAHAYLFTGPSGTGKKELAVWISQAIYCQQKDEQGYPCQTCIECRRISENSHPDVVRIAPEGQSIKVDQIRFLKSEFSKSGLESLRKIFIIEDAEKMTTGAANSLLKFLEEPSGSVNAFLLSQSPQLLLPTIISRCQTVELATLSTKQIIKELVAAQVTPGKASLLAHLCGDYEQALALSQDQKFEKLVENLWEWYNLTLRGDLRAFVDVQVKLMPYLENKAEQERLLQVLVLLIRDTMLTYYQRQDELAFKMYLPQLQDIAAHLGGPRIVKALEISLKSWQKLAVNVNFQNILEELTLNLSECFGR